MTVTEAQRHQLYESLKGTLGEAEAETFMNMQSPFDWNEVVTKTFLKAELKDLETRLLRTFGTWLFTSQAAVIAAMAVMLAVFR